MEICCTNTFPFNVCHYAYLSLMVPNRENQSEFTLPGQGSRSNTKWTRMCLGVQEVEFVYILTHSPLAFVH